jgi:hypothetical protein
LSFLSPSPHSSPSAKQTKIAIESLQEELSRYKIENEKLRGKNEAKAEQLKTLQQQMEAQAHRLAAIDGRLAQGQGALSAACTAAQSKETQILELREALNSRDQIVRDQAATVSRLDKMVADGEAVVSVMREKEASLEQERTTLTKIVQDLKLHIAAKETETRQQIAASTISTEAVHAQLKKVQADLAEEKSSRSKDQNAYETTISDLTAKLRRNEAELEAAKQHGAAGTASLRGLAERLVTERREWESERNEMLIECQKRLEEAEKWMEKAAMEAESQKKAAVQQMRFLDNDWSKRADEAIYAARQDERRRIMADQEAAAASASALKREQEAAAATAAAASRNAIDSRMQELAAIQHDTMAADYERLHMQVERCLEALADRVLRHQEKTDKKQTAILKHLALLAAPPLPAPQHIHLHSSPHTGPCCPHIWDSDYAA